MRESRHRASHREYALDCCGLFEALCFNEGWGEEKGLSGMSRERRGGRACPRQKFLFFVLKSSDVLDILVPILYFLNDARADQCKAGVGSGSLGSAPG